jgi:hypothetical protein
VSARYSAVDEVLLQRARNEFLEMPGLRLTCPQAQRLWGLDEWICLQVLDALVDAEFLGRSTHGMYARLSDGQAAYPQFKMVKARLEGDTSHTKKEAI